MLDASAVLVLLLDEPGAEAVAQVVTDGVLSAVNLAEVLSTLTDRGADVSGQVDHLVAAGVLIEPMTETDAVEVAALRGSTAVGCSASVIASASHGGAGCQPQC